MSGVMMGGADRWLQFLVPMELKGMALLALCALGALALRRGSAAGRHWVWLLGVTGLLALPLVQSVAPRWAAPLPEWAAPLSADRTVPVDVSVSSITPTSGAVEAPQAGKARDVLSPGVTHSAADETATQTPTPTVIPDAAPTSSPAPRAVSLSLSALALGIWMLGTLLLLGAVVASHLAARRLTSRSLPFPARHVTTLAGHLASALRIRRKVRILEGGPHTMPMSWGWFRPVVLLPAGAEGWSLERLEVVLLHELAHVRRADCLTQVVAEVALALHWMNPLAWMAARRLRLEREYACDDHVLSAGARASEYADQLLSLARTLRAERVTAMAAVAMARPANLSARMRAVLDATRRRSFGRMGAVGAGGVAASLVVALAALTPVSPAVGARASGQAATDPAPSGASDAGAIHRIATPGPAFAAAPQSATCGMDAEGWKSMSNHSENDRHRLEWSKPGCEVQIRVEGDVRFSSDFKDVARLGGDALLRVEEKDGRTERMLEVTAGAGGRPRYEYRVDRKEQPFDAAARAWYQGMLLQVFRRGGFMARERVASLLKDGGVPAVLRELDALTSDYVFATYTEELLKQADLSDAQALDAVKRARTRVDSDYYLASILQAFAKEHLDSDAMVNEYLAAAGGIDSDYYRSEVLEAALAHEALSADQVGTILKDAAGMDSDYYLSEVLTGVAKRYALAPALRGVYLDAVSSIDSDYYRSQVLGTLLARNDLSAGELDVVLQATAKMESATYVTELLDKVASMDLSSDELRSAYLRAVSGIESDYHRAEALGTLLKKATLSGSQVAEVVSAAAKIESDYYKSNVLLEVVHRYRVEGATRQAVIDAMNTIGSDYYRGQVAEQLLRK